MSERRPFIPLDEWKSAAQKATASGDVELRKGFAGVFEVAKAEGDGDKSPIRIRITTGKRDRDRDTINPAGWDLVDYRKNPVVLWGHDYRSFPMAKDTGLTIDENGIVGSPLFASAEENPWAPHCERLIRGGFLNAASVGFQPMKWAYNEEERGVDFEAQSLLEYSIVPVPANAGALVEARSAGIDVKWIVDWAEKCLDEYHGASGLWVSKATLEGARAEAKSAKVFAMPGLKSLWTAAGMPLKSEEEAPIEEPKVEAPVAGAGDGGASGEGGDGTGASSNPSDESVIELVDDAPAPAGEDVIAVDENELRALIGDAVKAELGPRLTALTGRID